MSVGILSFGAYLPRLRLQRKAIAEANGWFNAALKGAGQGRARHGQLGRGFRHHGGRSRARRAGVSAATGSSTSSASPPRPSPFSTGSTRASSPRRSSLKESVRAFDIAATQRAAHLGAARRPDQRRQDAGYRCREAAGTSAASPYEMSNGDGAAALVVGEGEPVARLIGYASRTADFVDHYRTEEHPTDYQWEERWIRDAGYTALVPPVIAECLEVGRPRACRRHPLPDAVKPAAARRLHGQGRGTGRDDDRRQSAPRPAATPAPHIRSSCWRRRWKPRSQAKKSCSSGSARAPTRCCSRRRRRSPAPRAAWASRAISPASAPRRIIRNMSPSTTA